DQNAIPGGPPMASEAHPSAAVLLQHAALSTQHSPAGRGLWRDAWRRLCRNRAALAGLGFIVLVALCAVLADVLAPYPFWHQDLAVVRQPPRPSTGSAPTSWAATS